ncbi:cysteine synthase [Aureococcus anophagefferens]|nr:cysteine synthase [Aureococcus anophagefferens]
MGRHGLMRPLLRHPRLIAAAATVSAYALLRWLRRKRLRRALAPAHPSWRDSAQAQLIGSTPLLPLHSLSKLCGCTILAKCEQANPSGTGKDRIALAMLAEAEASGALPAGGGGVVVEGSSGSTTIGLAPLVAAAGHRLVAVLPDDCAAEKRDAIAAFPGITIEVVRAASIASPTHYVNVARQRAADLAAAGERVLFANQFDNLANVRAHVTGTAREIGRQAAALGRTVDAFAMGAGTGGTIAGVSLGLGDGPRIYLADPQGSSLHGRVRHGVCYDARQAERFVERHRYDTIMDGVGLDRVTANFRAARVDDACRAIAAAGPAPREPLLAAARRRAAADLAAGAGATLAPASSGPRATAGSRPPAPPRTRPGSPRTPSPASPAAAATPLGARRGGGARRAPSPRVARKRPRGGARRRQALVRGSARDGDRRAQRRRAARAAGGGGVIRPDIVLVVVGLATVIGRGRVLRPRRAPAPGPSPLPGGDDDERAEGGLMARRIYARARRPAP